MEIYLIRHGKTKGNGEGRYIGSTDESLSDDGRSELLETLWRDGYKGADLKKPREVYVSRLKRTKETAELLFPGISLSEREGLNECSFGVFENKSYEELKEDPSYKNWIESGGVLTPPGGEAKADFVTRTIQTFEEILSEQLFKSEEVSLAFVVHGGSIMTLLEHYGIPRKGFYHWQVKNGCGYRAYLSEEGWRAGERNLTKLRSIP